MDAPAMPAPITRKSAFKLLIRLLVLFRVIGVFNGVRPGAETRALVALAAYYGSN
jgi:hypothetical protein